MQGDIIAIADKNAAVVAKYTYDAWGVCTVTQDSSNCNISGINPFRYRGYYYDAEIEMYYLQSRYYNPEIGRFVNADEEETIAWNSLNITTNLFAYCNNSPVKIKDDSGMFSFNDLYNKITGFLQNLFNKFMNNLKSQLQITRKYVKISVTSIKFILDLVITFVVSRFVKWGIEKLVGWAMKKYIQKSTISFIRTLGNILNHWAIKWLLKALVLRAVNLGYVKSTTNAVKSVAIDTILSVSTVLSKINSICSACSSVSGFIAFILDLADRKWDDYLTITFA